MSHFLILVACAAFAQQSTRLIPSRTRILPMCNTTASINGPAHPVVSGTHSRDCCVFNGGDLLSSYNWVGCLKQEKEFIKKSPNLSAEMTVKTEELACSMLTHTPEMIWRAVKAWCDNDHVMWHGLQQHQVCELVRKARRKLGQGDTIGTVENTPQYNSMSNSGRPLLHCSSCFPHPAKPNTNMRMMIFANPANLG